MQENFSRSNKRVQKNIEEGRGFRLMGSFEKKYLENLILQVQMNYGEHHWIL